MPPESKHPETPRSHEFMLRHGEDYISHEEFFEKLTEKLDQLGILHEDLLACGYDAAAHTSLPDPENPRVELFAYSLRDFAYNLLTHSDTPFAYVDTAERPAIAIYNPELLVPTDATHTHWAHSEGNSIEDAKIAIFYIQD